MEEEFGVGKPDQRVYFHALKKLDAKPSEAWIVGDKLGVGRWECLSGWASQPSGTTRKGVGYRADRVSRPDRIIGSLPELLQLEM